MSCNNVTFSEEEKNFSICTEYSPSVPFAENISTALNATWETITKPRKILLIIFKTVIAIPAALILMAITITLLCFVIFLHLAALPFHMMTGGWTKEYIKNYILTGSKELTAFVITVMTSLISGTQFDPPALPPGQKADKTPVLFIHGYLHSSAAWHFMRKRLEKEGIRTYTIDLGSPLNSISNFAQKVKQKVERIAKESGRNDILLVGHSMGGLVASEYATSLAPTGTVKGVITLGSPLQGTKIAPIGFGPCVRDMHYRSSFVIKLADKICKATHINFFNFGSKIDLIVHPSSSMLLTDSQHVKSHKFDTCGHLSFLYSPTVANSILLIHRKVST